MVFFLAFTLTKATNLDIASYFPNLAILDRLIPWWMMLTAVLICFYIARIIVKRFKG
jgi:hypothetical protein